MFGGYKLSALSILILSLALNSTHAQTVSKSDLKVKGTIVMYDTLPKEFRIAAAGMTQISIVKVLKVLRGKESSQYVIVYGSKKDGENFTTQNSGNKVFKLNLNRITTCDSQIQDLININVKNENNKIIRTIPRFTLAQDVNTQALPLTEKLPCYSLTGIE